MRTIDFFIAYRFLKDGRSQTALIFAGATVGVAVVVFLAALISGLQASLIEETTGLTADLVIEADTPEQRSLLVQTATEATVFPRLEPRPRRAETIEPYQPVVDELRDHPEVQNLTPVATGSGTAIRGQLREPVQLRGIDLESYTEIIDLDSAIIDGELNLQDQGVVIGEGLADLLSLEVGDRLRLSIAEGSSQSLTIRAIFDLGAGAPNDTWAFLSMRQAQSLLELDQGVTRLEGSVDDLFEADAIAARLQRQIDYDVTSWQETNQDLLRALNTQAASTILIGVFVAIAVALGIASVLVVTVVQKRGQVGVLRAMGTPRRAIQRVFLIQGGVVGLVGSVLGSVLGYALALSFNYFVRDETGEPIFPIEPSLTIIFLAFLLATVTGVIAALVPARSAAGLDPAEAITDTT